MDPTLAALLVALAAAPAAAAPACQGTLSGSAKGTFNCKVSALEQDGNHYLVIEPLGPVPGVPGYWPGSLQLPGKPEARSYRLDQLVAARASVGVEGGTLYTATKTSGQRGEMELKLHSVKADRTRPGVFLVSGTFRAKLIPAGAGKSGEVQLDVTF